MASPINKHANARRVFYSRFDGGLNLAQSPETLSRNELHEAKNVEIAPLTGKLKVRGGLVWINTISSANNRSFERTAPVQGSNVLLFQFIKDGVRTLGYYDYQVLWEVSGTLTGSDDVSAVIWDDVILIASGGRLQKLTQEGGAYKLTTISGSPSVCHYVFVRSGRVGVVSDDDTIRFSYVGDCTQWSNNPDDESTGQFIQIGYKDGMDINAVIPMSKDLIIFKSPANNPDSGIIWRLVGDFPNWVVVEAAHNTGTFSQRSVQVVGNDVFYIAGVGLSTLGSVTEYGEIKTSWPDRKVSNALTELITSAAELWHIPLKQQLWLLPSYNDEKIWVFDYIRGVWTNFIFPTLPDYVSELNGKVLVFIDDEIYELNDFYTVDKMKSGDEKIMAKIKLGAILTARQVLVKAGYATYETQPEVVAKLLIGKYKLPLKFRGSTDYIYDDEDIVYEDYDSLFNTGDDVMTSRARFMVRNWVIVPEVEITGGGFSLSTIGLETAEV